MYLPRQIRKGEPRGSWLRDLILGGQDGLVNVLGIVLGVSAANGEPRIIIAASLAAAFAEAVSITAVSYTSALAEKEQFEKELARETKEILTIPEKEREGVRTILASKGLVGQVLEDATNLITADNEKWIKFMMREELQLEPVEIKSVAKGSLVVGAAALLGSFVPIFPFLIGLGNIAPLVSVILCGILLFTIGVYKAKTYHDNLLKSGLQMLAIGLGAAIVGFLVGKIIHLSGI